MTLLFDETEVTYKRQEWNKFTLAYACSIHKSQGSEFQMVILPLVKQYGRMLQRKLIYTAVTRSKDFLILLGETEAFRLAIESEMIPRQTTLRHRLVEDELELKNQEHQMIAYEEEKTEAVKEELEKQPAVEVVKATEQTISLFEEVEDTVEEEILDYQLTLDMVKFLKVDPMIGMKNVTPYDFMTN
jgi:exodeoxyribonuclease V alpha subunit